MMFYLALLPTLVDLTHIDTLAWLKLTATMLVVLVTADLCPAIVASRARRLLTSRKAMRIANRASASRWPARPSRSQRADAFAGPALPRAAAPKRGT